MCRTLPSHVANVSIAILNEVLRLRYGEDTTRALRAAANNGKGAVTATITATLRNSSDAIFCLMKSDVSYSLSLFALQKLRNGRAECEFLRS